MKRSVVRFFTVLFVFAFSVGILSGGFADRLPEEKTENYIGAMRVVWCKEWVSLREEPKKTSNRLAEIPLGDIVYSCTDINDVRFYKCEYQGMTGYVLKGYLIPAPECEPPASASITRKMTLDEVTGTGETVLDWKDYNMSVVAAHEHIDENGKDWEVLRIGCFIDGTPIWGHEERCEAFSSSDMLKVFIGGVPDDWQVMVFNGAYGLSLLDLLSGKKRWCVTTANCQMGDAAAVAVGPDGTVYLAGSEGPHPVAISLDGRVLWKSVIDDPQVFAPYEIAVENGTVQAKYKCGMEEGYKLVTLDITGQVLSIRNQKEDP